MLSVCYKCLVNYFERNPFGKCPRCEFEKNPLPSMALKEFKRDTAFDLIIKHLLKNVNVHLREALIPSHMVESNFVCSICLSVFENTVIIKCLHRFCHSCIVKSLNIQSGYKNACPLCKEKIISRRHLYSDEPTDLIIKRYNEDKGKVAENSKMMNMFENVFDLTLMPYPQHLMRVQNKRHPTDTIYLKITTPKIMTGNLFSIFIVKHC